MANQINFTLYCATGNSAKAPALIQEVFDDACKNLEAGQGGEYKCVLTLQDDTEMTFHVNADPAFLQRHLPGMAGFYSQNPMKSEGLHQSVLQQIAIFNCVIGVVFDDTGDENRLNYLIFSLFRLAEKMVAFVFVPDGRLMTHEQKVLAAPDGSSDFDEFFPIAATDLIHSPEPERPEDAARRERSIAALVARGIPPAENLPVVVRQQDALTRTVREVAGRAVALLAVGIYSEALCTGADVETALRYLAAIDHQLSAGQFFSPAEVAYFQEKKPGEDTTRNFSWRYECCAVMLWALGLWELGYPDAICDVAGLSSLLSDMENLDTLLAKSNLRPLEELLDQADFILRCDWACVEARIHGQEPPAGLEPGVVMERHYAFNWLVGANGGAHWDDIEPHT